MSYQAHRLEFIARLAASGLPAHHAVDLGRKLMRHASTLQRLAVAQCNGDWPADNGQRPTEECPLCVSHWVPSTICGGKLADAAARDAGQYPLVRIACPDCRTAAAIRELVRAHLPQYQVIVTGDPRGYVVRLAPAEATREDIDCGRAPIVYVPGRE